MGGVQVLEVRVTRDDKTVEVLSWAFTEKEFDWPHGTVRLSLRTLGSDETAVIVVPGRVWDTVKRKAP